jgi:predicted acylesterase/phospholipase RssA
MTLVTGDQPAPNTLILKGGGVKGLAFAGAIQVLEEHGFKFDTYVGTSAGAITTILLAAGYDGRALEIEMSRKDFGEFLDKQNRLVLLARLVFRGWMHTGDAIVDWTEKLLLAKAPERNSAEKVSLSELPARTVIYASRKSGGEVIFDSRKSRSAYSASVAARYSASIPGFFRPGIYEDEAIYDGGMLNNFPVDIFLRDNPNTCFVALNLVERKNKGAPSWLMRFPLVRLLTDVVNIQLKQREQHTLTTFPAQIISINTAGIATTNFNLAPEEKEFLVASGRAAALQFLAKNRPGQKLSAAKLIAEMERASALERQISAGAARRSTAHAKRAASWLLVATVTLLALRYAPARMTRPLGLGPTPQLIEIYPKSSAFQKDFTQLLEEAQSEVFITAVNLFVTMPHQREEFLRKVQAGVNIRILVFDPTSPYLPEVSASGEADPARVREQCLSTLRELRSLQERIANGPVTKGRLEARIFRSVLHMRAYFIDPRSAHGAVIVNPYVNGGHFTETPAYRFGNPEQLPFQNYYTSLNRLWDKAELLETFIKANPGLLDEAAPANGKSGVAP